MEIGAKQLGAGCPTGPAMPPGRWFGLGGTGASTYAPDLQPVLPVYRERHRSRGFVSRGISAGVPYARELSLSARWIRHVDDQRYQKPADRSLPANEAGSHYGFAGRCYAGGGEQRVVGAASGRTSAAPRVERAGTDGANQAFAGVARGSDSARLATTGLRGNSAEPGGTGRYGKVAHQPGTNRTCQDFAANGSKAIMSKRRLVMAGVELDRNYRKLVGGWL